jgi:hypothetical protein
MQWADSGSVGEEGAYGTMLGPGKCQCLCRAQWKLRFRGLPFHTERESSARVGIIMVY